MTIKGKGRKKKKKERSARSPTVPQIRWRVTGDVTSNSMTGGVWPA